MARLLYSLLFYLALPLVLLRLWRRSRKAPAYAERLGERFGFGAERSERPLWIHAVSVGETLAIAPLVELLLARQPQLPILLTTTTPTGAERVRALFGDRVEHRYCPYDLPDALNRFLKRTDPRGLIVVETELWPNMIAACAARQLPVLVANARLSARSARGYHRFGVLTRPLLRQLSLVAAQHASDGERFVALGLPLERLQVTGSIKFDIRLPADIEQHGEALRQSWGAGRPVLVAGSTHEGEEQALLAMLPALRQEHPQLLLVLVPRHPERFDRVAELAQQQGYRTARRSLADVDTDSEVYIGDTMGELVKFYAAADLCFVGGSLIERGGHNPLEPAMLGKPVLMGSQVFNFAEICRQLAEAGGLTLAESEDQLQEHLARLLANPKRAQQQGLAARQFVAANQGALEQLYQLVAEQIGPS
ncbi:lipid IV(A) 3-deoxy-D-manno-octulosonic acid transferase [Marinobacterium arenosum]|uniref:lipid IV(A) 3-deoxy-D-manno-octulosonic acid transferase n=1 Tax=Marinobacterium arenosum TaxID=2862496 RepID=UPI001C976C18|nr:lipid IV(A) 3-deoxy-D-manno-octulosonic acid transferase [Marinobacterium arenosum]MBY4676432.1 lipid IV(A) 3-deoxy-D-manno-octulosonic acid transferase [Marinobacterium arenosum]